MTISPRRPVNPPRRFPLVVLASVALASAGCGGGDNPSRQAGTIELPERKFNPPPDAKSFLKDKANPKDPNP